MRRYRITYTETAKNRIRHLPPLIKPSIKALIEKLAENPQMGKPLRYELAGYWSCRFQRWRLIYMIGERARAIEIHLIEKRVSVYESMKDLAH